MKWKVFIFLFLILAIILLFEREVIGISNGPEKKIIVKSGESASIICNKMNREGIIRFPLLLEAFMIIKGIDRNIKPGNHIFNVGESYFNICDELIKERLDLLKITIPEGFTKKDIIKKLSNFWDIQTVLKAFSKIESEGIRFYGYQYHNSEGFLFPDTYKFTKTDNPEKIIRMMISHFDEVFRKCRKNAIDMNAYKQLILASIVEGEAKLDKEKPIIAGVFMNRLKKGMSLDSCATIEYVIKQCTGSRKKKLSNKDIKINSPYNTYIIKGLPPAPICSPGRESIKAAMRPAKHDYLYFVSMGNFHHFSHSLREHDIWKRKAKIRANNKK